MAVLLASGACSGGADAIFLDSGSSEEAGRSLEVIADSPRDAEQPDTESDFSDTESLDLGGDGPETEVAAEVISVMDEVQEVFPADEVDAMAADTLPGDSLELDAPADSLSMDSAAVVCPEIPDPCLGDAFLYCDPATAELFWKPRPEGSRCLDYSCDRLLGWVPVMLDGTPCEDGDQCSTDDVCLGGACMAGFHVECDDGNQCTQSSCISDFGCMVSILDGSVCDDGDPCTMDDRCNGITCEGSPLFCVPGSSCEAGQCVCKEPCVGRVCGEDPCGNACGQCQQHYLCQEGACVLHYPDPPYGVFSGNTIPNYAFRDPFADREVRLEELLGQGRLLLMVFSAGWCHVCKRDALLFGQWLKEPAKAELRILEILYEDEYMQPAGLEAAQKWKTAFGVTHSLLVDSATVGPKGDAAGGVLDTLVQPLGPLDPGFFPQVLLLCPADMRILYITTGFSTEEMTAKVNYWLSSEDCGNPTSAP